MAPGPHGRGMGECAICEGDDGLPNRCRHCHRVFCAEHRLPETHDCPGLDRPTAGTRHFESTFDAKIGVEPGEDGDAGSGGLLSRLLSRLF